MYFQKITDKNNFEFYVNTTNLIIENNSSVALIVYLNDVQLFEVSGNSTLTLNCISLNGFLKFKNIDNSELNFKFLTW